MAHNLSSTDRSVSDPVGAGTYGVAKSLRNLGLLFALIAVILLGLGAMLLLGTLADRNMDKVHRRLESHRKMRQPPDTTPIPLPQNHED
jgi:hypothetical protein